MHGAWHRLSVQWRPEAQSLSNSHAPDDDAETQQRQRSPVAHGIGSPELVVRKVPNACKDAQTTPLSQPTVAVQPG
jgi:hypothetical protein